MLRKLVTLMLLVGVLWQSLAMAGASVFDGNAGDFDHAVMHMQSEGHHHHDDHTYHADDSIDSTQHVALDGALSLFELPQGLGVAFGVSKLPHALPGHDSAFSSLTADGLLRPPRFLV